MSSPFQHTIAAIATPPGRGAVALVRISGPGSLDCLLRLCPSLSGRPPAPRVQRLLVVTHPGQGRPVDHALVCWFPGPHSFTGEDTVELSTHGGALTPQLVLDAAYAAGARPAVAGEFTHRAVLNGRMDLLQAEAVLDMIDSRSPALQRAAIHQMERGLSQRIGELREAILRVEALVAYSIDFPEEDEPPVPAERIVATTRQVAARLESLLATAPQGALLREGALVVLAGRPNSGKSSLFNALLGLERAIVTEIPGTTRDALEAELLVGGYPFRLVDTAGLRETEDRVEGMGIEVARRYLAAAQLVLFCVEAGREPDAEEREFLDEVDPARLVLLRTKADLAGSEAAGQAGLPVAAPTGQGLDAVRREMLDRAFGAIAAESEDAPLVTRERHARALRAARDELALFLAAMDDAVPAELAATHLRAAVGVLEDLIGVVTPDDVLGAVFGQFCVGK